MPRAALLLLVLLAALAVGWGGLPAAGAAGGLSEAPALAHPEPNDVDGDEVKNEADNCPDVPNGRQNDADRDGRGDACDDDDDDDGRPDGSDPCPTVASDPCPPPLDTDFDGVADDVDNAPFKPPNGYCDDDRVGSHNPDQLDSDRDDFGDVCDPDDDNDARADRIDNCRTTFNPPPEGSSRQDDFDGDGIGSACDLEEPLSSGGGGSGGGSAVGGGGGSAGSGSERPSAADRSAPVVAIDLARRYAVASGPRSFVVPVRCSERCTMTVRLEVAAPAARRLRVGSRKTVLAEGRWALGGKARAFVFCDWSAKAARALRRLPRSGIRARVVVVAKDAAGNRRTASRTVTLRR